MINLQFMYDTAALHIPYCGDTWMVFSDSNVAADVSGPIADGILLGCTSLRFNVGGNLSNSSAFYPKVASTIQLIII